MNKTILGFMAATSALLAGCATPDFADPASGSSASGPVAQRLSRTPALAVPAIPAAAQLRNDDSDRTVSAIPSPVAGLNLEALGSDSASDVRPIDPLAPSTPIDPLALTAQEDLWQRIRNGYAMPDLEGELVASREQFYAAKPEYMRRMAERGGRYLYHVVDELEKRHMPTELALLPFVESAFNPQAISVAKASGMWQFVPATGKDYALKQNIFRDDRRDVLASTRAALDYLDRLHTMFNDWQLALAAYNWGEGNVQRAIARNEKAGLPTDYASLKMPDETRYYVPKLQAIKNIVSKPEQFAVQLPPLKNHPYFLSVPIERDMDVALAAKLANVPLEEFKQLNPQMNKPVILAAGTEQVLLPYDNANLFADNLRAFRGQLASWTAWQAPRTLHPGEVARQVGMSEAQLREVNRIPPRMLVKAGSTLLVPRGAKLEADVPEALADNATMALAPDVPPLRRMTLRAGKKGDSVAAVAQRYRVSAVQVAAWNKVTAAAKFKPGVSYVVFVPQAAPSQRAATRVASTANARTATARATKPAPATRNVKTVAKPVRVAQR
ncbi:transglycosylase SLT domain-containing protein [Ideonella azotifigens]|uniref:Transglycosylase SLT domain-containing protein n=1 Tax=Ideonella azotifigens TaxID=513160 RepID=A0ABN1K7Z9_9BURK|nr:transglycosylase SLT domain-containing protein [Ideonella azotifigens]MCD2342972.1 transglycosylase SLT domain-containing protein [Ideonella azotifigens]